jgi:hypothetical protein
VSIIHITVMMLSGKPPFNIVRLGNVPIWMPRVCLICRAGEGLLTFNNSVVIYNHAVQRMGIESILVCR